MAFLEVSAAGRRLLAGLFVGHRPSFLIDAVLEGRMGVAVADDADHPRVACLRFADIVVYGGDVDLPAARTLAGEAPCFKAILPGPAAWESVLREIHGDRLVVVPRYGFSEESLDRDRLAALSGKLSKGYAIRRIDEELALRILADPELISEDHVHNFGSAERFLAEGIGFCVLDQEDIIVAGASSYAVCSKGIEVQVNTHERCRGQGLATAVSAALLGHCLDHGITAHWDAGNETSQRLARRLGFTPRDTYLALIRIA
jgi:GNAT superfamily N-acetyltransferase